MISVQLNLDQKMNQVHAELGCTELNSDQPILFSWTAVVILWTTLIGQTMLGPTTVTSQSHAMLSKQSSVDWPYICSNLKFPWSYYTIFASTVRSSKNTHFVFQ